MKRSGFTLIEVVIASALFAVVAIVGAATLSGTYKVQKQVNIIQSRQEAVRTTLEQLSREVRFSKNVQIDNSSLTITEAADSNGNSENRKYYLQKTDANNGTIYQQKVDDNGVNLVNSSPIALTANSAIIDEFSIKKIGNQNDSPIFIYIKVHANDDPSQTFESSVIATPRGYSN
jgi:prepilin-type N-terminal cleavage/methylation domain-containing protein